MDKHPLLRKGLTVGVILLFIGVAVVPSINFNIVRASAEDDLIEVTTEICGLPNFGNYTARLTAQQNEQVEALFASLDKQLNSSTSGEEVEVIMNNTIEKLYEYGVIPKEVPRSQIQHLIMPDFGVKKTTSYNFSENENAFCLLVGNVGPILPQNLGIRLAYAIPYQSYQLIQKIFTQFKSLLSNLLSHFKSLLNQWFERIIELGYQLFIRLLPLITLFLEWYNDFPLNHPVLTEVLVFIIYLIVSIVTIFIIGLEPVINIVSLVLLLLDIAVLNIKNIFSNIAGLVKYIIDVIHSLFSSFRERFHTLIIKANFLLTFCAYFTPVTFGQIIGLGVGCNAAGNDTPAQGWLFTLGLNKGKYWRGTFSGALPIAEIILVLNNLNTLYSYPGILGFTVLKITTLNGTKLLGSALWVKISPESLG